MNIDRGIETLEDDCVHLHPPDRDKKLIDYRMLRDILFAMKETKTEEDKRIDGMYKKEPETDNDNYYPDCSTVKGKDPIVEVYNKWRNTKTLEFSVGRYARMVDDYIRAVNKYMEE